MPRLLTAFRLILCFLAVSALPAAASAKTSILFFGDSLVAGYGLKKEEALPAQVGDVLSEKGYDVFVLNSGVSGDTTSGGRSRIEWTLNRTQPQIVVLALGANDLLRGVKPSVVYDNLDAMLQILQKRNIKTILVRVVAMQNYDAAYVEEFNKIFPELGYRYNAPVYPFFLEGIYGRPGYMLADGVHPNARGVAYVAKHLSDYLASTKWLPKTPESIAAEKAAAEKAAAKAAPAKPAAE